MRPTILLIAAALMALPPTPVLAQGSQRSGPQLADRADALFNEGNDAFDRGDFAAAAEKYAVAFSLKPTHDIAANLGTAELKLKRWAAAANHLAFALRHLPPSERGKRRDFLTQRLDEARTNAGALTITVEDGAEISVDGAAVGRAPLPDVVFVDPGEHVVSAERGGRTGRATTRANAGESGRVDLVLASESAGPVLPSTPPSMAPSPPPPIASGPPVWPGLVIGGTGIAVVGVGLGLFVAGEGASSDARDVSTAITDGGGSCDPPVGPGSENCAAAQDDFDTANTLRTAGGAAMVVGGAAIVGGAVYLIWSSSQSPTSDARLTPWIGADVAGGSISGRF